MNKIKNVTYYINWEQRAKERRKENKALKKRIKELITSRDGWKEKATRNLQKLEDAEKKLNSLKGSFKKNFG